MAEKTRASDMHKTAAHLDYRTPMKITELYIHRNGDGYYVCPRCRVTLEREFTSYCDRCGQCLNWSAHQKARRIYGRKPDI